MSRKLSDCRFFPLRRSGFTLLEAALSMAFLGVLLFLSSKFVGLTSSQQVRASNKNTATSIEHYLLGFPNCTTTALDPKFETNCKANQAINIYDLDGNIIIPESGRKFGNLIISSKCDQGLVTFFSKLDSAEAIDEPLYGEIGRAHV